MRGLTLLEVLVAVALTAAIGVLAFGAIHSASEQSRHLLEHDRRLAELTTTVHWLVADLRAAVPASILDSDGQSEPALLGDGEGTLALTARGFVDPEGAVPALYRVRYSLRDGALLRQRHTAYTRAEVAPEPEAVALMRQVDAFSLRFLGSRQIHQLGDLAQEQWLRQWPEAGSVADDTAWPWAVLISIRTRDLGSVQRIVELGGHAR